MRWAAALLGVVLVPACTAGVHRKATPTASAWPAPVVSLGACRTSTRPPDPKRPVIRLTFALDARHTTVRGTEHVVFTPALPIRDMVFRLWLNGPELQR